MPRRYQTDEYDDEDLLDKDVDDEDEEPDGDEDEEDEEEEPDDDDDEKEPDYEEDDEDEKPDDEEEDHGLRKGVDAKTESRKRKRPLPIPLRAGGIADQMLKTNATAACASNSAAELLEMLMEDLYCLRASASSSREDATSEDAYYRLLHAKAQGDPHSPCQRSGPKAYCVYRLCLVRHARFEERDDLWEAALAEYRKRRDDFDLILGDFLPEDLRATAAELDFNNNLDPTATQDWEFYRHHLQKARRSSLGLVTGFHALDQATGGLRGVTLLVGPTMAGKTTLALNWATGVLQRTKDVAVVFYTLEASKKRLFDKLLSREAGIDYGVLGTGPLPAQQERELIVAEARLREEILPRLRFIDRIDLPDNYSHVVQPTLLAMRRHIQETLAASGMSRCLVVVDSLRRLYVDGPIIGFNEKDVPQRKLWDDMDADEARLHMLMDLQHWTRTRESPDGDPIVVIARVRKWTPGHRLTLADVFGRTDLVYDADSVVLLEPSGDTTPHAEVVPTLLNVAKIRDGGQCQDLQFMFHHATSQFEEVERPEKPGGPPASDGGGKRKRPKRFSGKS